MYLEYGTILSVTILYAFYLKKDKQATLIISLFLLTILCKLFFIYLEITNLYINHFTIRDESTFIEAAKQFGKHSDLNILLITPGDSFLFYILNLAYSLFKTEFSIKLVPIIFSIISFHYSLKLTKILKFKEIYVFFTISLIFFWPSNFLFNYSATKEFLQTTFLICLVYYSFKLFAKINISLFLKYFISLILFSYSHEGFEIIAIIHTAILFSLITLSKIRFNLGNLINLISISAISIIFVFILLFYGSLDNFTQKIIHPDFIDWYNNQRVSTIESANTYRISIDSISLTGVIYLICKTSFYYFFYLPNISNYFYIYYFIEITLTFIFFIIVFSVLLFRNYFIIRLPNFSIYKVLLILFLYLIINFGFAFFNANIGNAIRHKTVSFFIVFMMLPFIYILIEDLISKFSIKKLYDNNNK